MFQSTLGHHQINEHSLNLAWYKDLYAYLGWTLLEDSLTLQGFDRDVIRNLWFFGGANSSTNDFDGPGMNPIGLLVQQQQEVDQGVAFLSERGIAPLFDTSRHRPEFRYDTDRTDYQVMFEAPDQILLEAVAMSFPGNTAEWTE